MFALALVTSVCALRDPCSRQTCVGNLREDTGELPVVLARSRWFSCPHFHRAARLENAVFFRSCPIRPRCPAIFENPAGRAGLRPRGGRGPPRGADQVEICSSTAPF